MSLFKKLKLCRTSARRPWLRYALFATTMLSSGVLEATAAENSYGFYAGGAVGEATLRSGNVPYIQESVGTTPAAITAHDTGWKALIGIRPTSYVGAELEYIDFGSVRGSIPGTFVLGNVAGNLRSNATALFGVGYLPVPLSRTLLDVYAKTGVARYQSSDKFSSGILSCLPPLDCVSNGLNYRISRIAARFAYGVGAQIRLSAITIQTEYERIAANGADPDLLSLGLTWNF